MLGQLFVTGSPHARVLDVGLLLNEHPQVLLGVERFSGARWLVDPFLLAPERLVEPLSIETRVRGELLYARLGERAAREDLAIVGDVDPAYVRVLDRLDAQLAPTRAVVVLDGPTEASVGGWRTAVSCVRETERNGFAAQMFVLPFGPFATGDERWLGALLAFLELPLTDRLVAQYARLRAGGGAAPTPGTPAQVDDVELIEWVRERAAFELARHDHRRSPDARVGDVAPTGDELDAALTADELDAALNADELDAALNADELDARAREREQLMSQRGAGSEWPDQRKALEARYFDQARELLSRGERIRRARLTAAHQLPCAEYRINLVSPEPRPQLIGRAEAIEQLARHLGRLCTVRLISPQPPRMPLPGVEVRSEPVTEASALNDCDVVIYPGDMPGAAGLVDGVRAVMLLDGFEAPAGETVLANLESAREVVASSHWLCRLAHEHGVPATYLPLGLDRHHFARGPRDEHRELRVTGMTQAVDWLCGSELSEAMVRVREARPEVQVTFFGGVPADGATEFVAHPTFRRLTEVLRASAVHVVSSREEGFGFMGAAALACGAALVTTETKGSREYAIHGRTALVVCVGDPDALADNVLALLEDATLRGRLAADGGSHVRSLMRPWPEVARSLAVMLTERE